MDSHWLRKMDPKSRLQLVKPEMFKATVQHLSSNGNEHRCQIVYWGGQVIILNYSVYYQSMSASKRSPYFYSPLKVESDQKEIIIAHLQDQIYVLKRNQQELIKLQDQYRALEHRFRLLSEEKAHADADFKDRHDLALRTICQLKNEIDALRADLREKNLEINDLESDENTLIGQLDQRAIEIDKLKNELNSLLSDNEELLNERLKLQQTASGVRKDNELLCANAKELELNNDSVRRKMDDLDKYSGQLKSQESILKEKIIAYENENNGLDGDINATVDDIGNLESQVSNAQNDLITLQKDIAEVSGKAQKFKSESIHYHKGTQAEIMRNNDLAKVLHQAENTHRLRINQVDEGNKEVSGLAAENDKLSKLNGSLKEDIQYCRKHLENLSLLNSDLVVNLERYSQQDDIVRNLIDRRARVVKARAKVEEVGVMMTRSTGYEGSGRKSKLMY